MFDRTLKQAIVLALAATLAAQALAQEAATTASVPAVLGTGDRGDAVFSAQVLLDRAHFSSGEIDGVFGSNVGRAVAAFQRAKGLDASGKAAPLRPSSARKAWTRAVASTRRPGRRSAAPRR